MMSYPVTRGPTQRQESDVVNDGGTAPGGTVAFMGLKGMDPDPATQASLAHYGLKDEPPSIGKPVLANHPCEANDGEPLAPDGMHRGESPEIVAATRGAIKP
jgi:hypothetical protein